MSIQLHKFTLKTNLRAMQRYLLWASILYHPHFTLSMLYIHLAKNIHVLNSCGSPREQQSLRLAVASCLRGDSLQHIAPRALQGLGTAALHGLLFCTTAGSTSATLLCTEIAIGQQGATCYCRKQLPLCSALYPQHAPRSPCSTNSPPSAFLHCSVQATEGRLALQQRDAAQPKESTVTRHYFCYFCCSGVCRD